MNLSDTLGYVGGAILAVQSIPQIVKVVRTKSSRDISYATIGTFMFGSSLMFTYGILEHRPPVYITLAISIVLNATLACLKVHHDRFQPAPALRV